MNKTGAFVCTAAIIVMMIFIDVDGVKMVNYTQETILVMEDQKSDHIENNILIITMDDVIYHNIKIEESRGGIVFPESNTVIANEYDIGNKLCRL